MPQGAAAAHIDARVLAGLADELRSAGHDPHAIGRAVGLDAQAWTEAGGSLALRQFVGLLEAAGSAGEDTGFVWRCGRRYGETKLAHMFPFAAEAGDLGTALRLIVRALALFQTDSIVRLAVAGDLASIEYRVLDPSIWPRSRDVEFTFGFLEGVVRRFAGPSARPEGLVFEHAPDGRRGRIDRHLGVACIYEQTVNTFSIPARLMAMRPSDPRLADDAERTLAALAATLAEREAAAALPERLRRAVLSLIGSGEMLDQEAVAAACGLSERTLRRRLQMHGLSFRDEVERLRVEYARETLVRTRLPMGEIARRLGYSEQSAFTRAFRRSAGVPPTRLRGEGAARAAAH
jgi:AraC-like DNA-binding protein